jgi:hypothetical protein
MLASQCMLKYHLGVSKTILFEIVNACYDEKTAVKRFGR